MSGTTASWRIGGALSRRIWPVLCAVIVWFGAPAAALASTGWSTPSQINQNNGMNSVSCPTSSFCVALSAQNGAALIYQNGSWGSPSTIDSGNSLSSVSCSSDSYCVAVDTSGNELTYNSGSWSTPTSVDSGGRSTSSVSCPASTIVPAPFCVVVDISGRAVIDNSGTWGAPATVDSSVAMTSVSCVSASFCTAVGLADSGGSLSGDAVSYNGTAWSSATTVASGESFLDAVSCSSPSFCAAVGTGFVSGTLEGLGWTWNGSAWSSAQALMPSATIGSISQASISCTSGSFCQAVFSSPDAALFNGTSWSVESGIDPGNSLSSVSCATQAFCEAVDAGGNALTYIGQASPAIATTASASVTAGGTISDSATLSGGTSPTGTITFTAYGPDDATCSGTPAFTSPATVTGNGTYGSGTFTTSQAGTYRWIASYSGDSNNTPVSGSCNDPNESVTVSKAPATIATTASGPVAAGGTISDSALLSGGAGASGTITFNVYGPTDLTCASTPAFTSTATVTGNGTYGSGTFTTSQAGTYRWIASYSGDSNNTSVSGSCNDPNESVTVSKAPATIATTASGPVAAGGTISDSALLSGGAGASGTITFNVYGPTDLTCASTPAFTSTATVTGNGTYSSGTFTTSQAGTYRWIASYGGDANNDAATTSCGDPGESVAVAQAASTTTLSSSHNPSRDRQQTTFTATVSGTSPTGTVTFNDGSHTLGSGVLGAGGTAAFATSRLGPGRHRITAVYGGDAANAGSNSNGVVQIVKQPSNHFTASRIKVKHDGTVTFVLKLAGPGLVDVMESARNGDFATAAYLLQPSPRRFVFARKHLNVARKGVVKITLRPDSRGRKLIAHHRYPIVLTLWISYTPTAGRQRNKGFHGLHLTP